MIYQFVALLAAHWFADFVLQTHWQASNKSKDNEALARHVGVYTLVLMVCSAIIFGQSTAWVYFVFVNGSLHFVTDYITSRMTSKLYVKKDWHNFFVVVGFDQFIHQITIAGTMIIFFGGKP